MKNSARRNGTFFARVHATHKRLVERSCESLLGVCTGILADNDLNELEIRFLELWLKDNVRIADTWPGIEITRRVRDILADGKITSDELAQFKGVLTALIGGTLQDTGTAAVARPIQLLPFDDRCSITFARRIFCLTGEFIYGPRTKCTDAILRHGGEVIDGIRRDLHYLVVGSLVSQEWKNTSFGTKIEKAMKYRDKGIRIAIVSEERWSKLI